MIAYVLDPRQASPRFVTADARYRNVRFPIVLEPKGILRYAPCLMAGAIAVEYIVCEIRHYRDAQGRGWILGAEDHEHLLCWINIVEALCDLLDRFLWLTGRR